MQDPSIFLIISGYFGVLLILSFLRNRKGESTGAFIIADRKLGIFPFVASLVSTTYGWILGSGQMYYEFGISAWFNLSLPYLIFSGLYAWFFASRARRMNAITLTDIIKVHYDRKVQVFGTLSLLLFLSPVMYLLMAGQVLHFITGWSKPACIATATVFSIVYVLSGGFRTMVRAEIVQFLLMFIGFISVVAFLLYNHGTEPLEQLPEQKITPGVTGSWLYMLTWLVLASVTLVDPSYNQRVFAVKRPSVAVTGIIIAIVLWLVFDVLSALSSLYGYSLLGDIADKSLVYPALAAAELPPWLAGLFFVGLLSMIMSTADSFLFLSALMVSKDILHDSGWFKNISLVKLTRYVLLIAAFVAFFLTLSYQDKSVVDVFFDFVPLVVSVVLLPVLSCYIEKVKLPSNLVFLQMLLSAAVCIAWMLLGNHLPASLAELNPVFPGLLVSLLVQVLGIVLRRVKA